MAKDYSPFTPGLPVPVEFFVGRLSEIQRLKDKVDAASQGRLEVAWLSGERGIGKSSLASFVRSVAERDKVLGLHVLLGGVTQLGEMVRRVFDRLVKQGNDSPWFTQIKELFKDHIREVGLFGVNVEFEAPDRDLQHLVHNFSGALQKLMERLRDEKKGLFLILDDINGLASSAAFADWLKSLVDEIATDSTGIPLCLCLVGLEERRQSLVKLNPSLGRVFDLVDIRQWDDEENHRFYANAFQKVGTAVEKNALDVMVSFSGGLPVLAHEIGDAVFKVDDDNVIDDADAVDGIVAAADIVGRKYLEPQVFSAIRSTRYRSILRRFATEKALSDSFKRADLLKLLSDAEKKVLDNFLAKMKLLGVIVPDTERGRGAYRFQNVLHYLYFHLYAAPARRGSKSQAT